MKDKPISPSVAVIGCGNWGKNLVRNFHALGALQAVCDTDPEIQRSIAEKYDVPAVPLTELYQDETISAVVIAAPAEQHFKLAWESLSAGKHVFVEKPLALDVDEAESLCRLAEEKSKLLMVGHLLQYHPAFLRLKEMVRQGKLGRVQHIYANRLNLGKVRREENILWSFAPHDISMILSIVGDEPREVSAVGSCYLHDVIADVTTTHLKFPGGESAHVFVSWLHPYKEQKLVVVGSEGMAVFDDGMPWDSKILHYPHRINWVEGRPQPSRAEAQPIPVEEQEPLMLECSHFLECIAQGLRPRTDGAEGVRVLRVLQSAEQSMRNGGGGVINQDSTKISAPAAKEGVRVHESAYLDEPCEVGAGTRIWHFSHVLKGSRIGRNCNIGQNVMIGPDVSIGDNCKIQNNVSVYPGVTLEDGVFCGPSCVFTNVINPRAEIDRKDEFRKTVVKCGTTIGANATIVCGATLGEFSFIAAGAVVTGDVPPHALMAGVPARRIGWMSHSGDKLGTDLVCPREGRKYREIKPNILEEILP